MEEVVAANEAAILERRHEIRTSLRAVENSLREAGAVTDGYNSVYLLESPTAHWGGLQSSSLFRRQTVHVSEVTLARSAAHRFDFDAPDKIRHEWRLSALGEAKCRRIWRLFDADEDERWTHGEFLEYMAALKCSSDSVEIKAFEDSAEVWGMYMSDMCELDEEGKLTFEGFEKYRELIEDEQPLERDLAALGVSLEWEELKRMERIKQLFDEYVDDPTGNVTAKAAQYLLAEIGFVLTSEETAGAIERRYQLARCQRFIHQLKRTLRLFGYRQKSALRFANGGLPTSGNREEQPRICKVGLLSLVFSSWYPATKTRWRRFFLQCRLHSFCALRRLKRRVRAAFMCVRQVSATGLLSASCLQSRTPGGDRGDYMLKVDIGPKFSTTATIHLAYNSDADSAATLHELKYLERGAECFLHIDLACRSGTKENDAHILVEKVNWFIGEFFRDHIESLPFFHRWFVTIPTKQQLRMGPASSGAAGTPSVVIRLVILFTGGMDLYHVMQGLGLPSSMQFDHLLQRFSLRCSCSHSLEDLLVTKKLNLGAQLSCRTQMDVRLNRQAWAQIFAQVAHHLDAKLVHEREDAEYIAQIKAEREQKKKKSVMLNQRRPSVPIRPGDSQQEECPRRSAGREKKTESRQHLLIKSLRRVARALQHSQQLSSTWAFTNLGSALRENQWFHRVLSPEWLGLLKYVLDTPGGLAEEWKAKGDSLRAEFAETNHAMAGARPVLGHHPTSRTAKSSTEFTLDPLSARKAPPTTRSSETPKLTERRSHIQHESQLSHLQHEPKVTARLHHEPKQTDRYDPNQPTTNVPESTEEKSTEELLLEFYDLCARHLQGVHVVRAEAGTSGVTCTLEDRLHVLDVGVSVEAPTRVGPRIQERDSQRLAVCLKTRVVAIANGRFVDLYGVCNNSLHPFTFLQQISIADHAAHLPSSISDCSDNPELSVAVATCVAFPVPGLLLVGAFVAVPESEISGTGGTVDSSRAVFLLGFRLYAGSVTQFIGDVGGKKPREVPASVQVYFSFLEPVVGAGVKSIRCLQSFRRDMTPDQGSVLVLFDDSITFGVLSWKDRFSDRWMCLAQMKQPSERLVVVECSSDGRFLVVGDAGGRLSLIDFKDFPRDGYETSSRLHQTICKRLELGACSRSGVITRDNPLEHARLVHTTAIAGADCAYTSLRWWVCGIREQLKQFVLAGKQDGSLHILKFIQGEARATVDLKLVQMFPGLASGMHDAIRSISEPVKVLGDNSANDAGFEFSVISEMRWRTWRIKIATDDEELSKRYRMIWPSVRDSLDFPSFSILPKAVNGTVLLPSGSNLSKLVAKSLLDASPDNTARYPIALMIADNHLQAIGLLTNAPVKTVEASSESGIEASDLNENENDDKTSKREEIQAETATIDTEERSDEDRRPSGPTTIQDKYKLPPMQWKTPGAANPKDDRLTNGKGHEDIPLQTARLSKLSRVDYNERVVSAMQRVETLSGVMKSMRASFQLFSSDVQHHMNLVSEQVEEISRRRVT
ncbi:hypothetical protein PHYPSEUDO_013905 [Phytophthora pseudosyringae]|uniref:EF-hand domain-containing protein n=1 Tax=Phytophthora pseudosyringae TaxID=221518 RepID=A0A8T1W2M0_9STRA|nr:hypothetical protein PHYPSEUDO_013905 [Phytophthora pseudosyringae]